MLGIRKPHPGRAAALNEEKCAAIGKKAAAAQQRLVTYRQQRQLRGSADADEAAVAAAAATLQLTTPLLCGQALYLIEVLAFTPPEVVRVELEELGMSPADVRAAGPWRGACCGCCTRRVLRPHPKLQRAVASAIPCPSMLSPALARSRRTTAS